VASWIEKFRTPPDLSRSIYLSPGYFLKGVVNPDLRVCPLCLQEQSYIRLTWRLAPISTCTEHGCMLQERCATCDTLLIAAGQTSQHLRCSTCRADLRALPVAAAPAELLKVQRGQLPSLRYLLDPAVVLAKIVDGGGSPAQAIGLKFRYLRSQTGLSVKAMAQRIGLADETLTGLELGQQVPFIPTRFTWMPWDCRGATSPLRRFRMDLQRLCVPLATWLCACVPTPPARITSRLPVCR
jgi:hypothetical protein